MIGKIRGSVRNHIVAGSSVSPLLQIRELSATEQAALADSQRLRQKKPSLLEQLRQRNQYVPDFLRPVHLVPLIFA